MLERLQLVAGADLSKVHTIEAEAPSLEPAEITAPQLCLIDGEHTHDAALADARFCRAVLRDRGAIVFHDRRLVRSAIECFLEELGETPHEGYPLLGSVYVLELGPTLLMPIVQRLMAGREEPKPYLMDHPARRYP
jgi:hypothetical protein